MLWLALALLQATPVPLKVNLGLSGTLLQGNAELAVLTGSLALHRKTSTAEVEFRGELTYGRSGQEVSADRGMTGLRLDRYILDPLELFLLGSWEYDRVAGILNRGAVGGGVKWVFWKAPKGKASLSGAFVREYQHLEGLDPEANIRFSLRPKADFELGPAVALSFVGFYQPNLADPQTDYRLRGTLSLLSRLTQVLSLRVELTDRYENRVPVGKKRNDLSLTVGLDLGLQLERP